MKTVLLCVVILAGCASVPEGIEMTEAEAKACKEQGCSVWTVQELQGMARRFFGEGYKAAIGLKSI